MNLRRHVCAALAAVTLAPAARVAGAASADSAPAVGGGAEEAGRGKALPPDTPMSSDGSVTEVAAASVASTQRNGFAGRGPARARPQDGPNEAATRRAATAERSDTSIESVIGPDGRERVKPTTSYPARATALVTWNAGSCTGWFISASTVVTAGHCVHRGWGGGQGWHDRRSFRVYPGRNGSASPYGSCTAKSLHAPTGWMFSGSPDHDYGAIKLNCTIGNTVGWYGVAVQTGSLAGLPVTIQGYPGDKPFGTQWRMRDKVVWSTTTRLGYAIDTFGGQSGSPIWRYRSVSCPVCAIGIHGYGVGGHPTNSGARITRAVFDNLVAWQAS